MVAKRSVKSSRHPLRTASTRNRATRSAPSSEEGSPLERRQPIERQEQRDRQILGSARLSGANAAVSTTGSGSQGPTYSSCRARTEVSMLRQIRVVVVMRKALESDTLLRSVECQRKYVSCTASSASATDPNMRYASPSKRWRYGSQLAAGFDNRELTPYASPHPPDPQDPAWR
jgi:hypothetical protein